MKIEEIPAGQLITLSASIGSEQLDFATVVQEPYAKKHLVLADPIYKDNKVITFRAKNLIVNMTVQLPEQPPFIFKNVAVELMKKPDNTLCYTISTLAEGKVLNRRESFRCFVGTNTTVMCATNREAYDATIRDISIGGFALVCDAETGFKEGQVLHVLLSDYIEELAENFSFHLYGIIVRTEELRGGRILYGCRMNTKVVGIENYIMKKERIRLKHSNGR